MEEGFKGKKPCPASVIITSACFPIPTIQKIAYTFFTQWVTFEMVANFHWNWSVNKVSLQDSHKIFHNCKLIIPESLLLVRTILVGVLICAAGNENDIFDQPLNIVMN